jgi:hypothetical protein
MSPELLKTSTQEVSITSEKYSDWFTKEYTFSRSEWGAWFGWVSIMRPLNAEDAGEWSELQQAAQWDDPVRDSQRLWYGENTSVLDRANAWLNDQWVHSWSDLRNIATQSVQYEFDWVRDQLNQDIEEMTNGWVSAHDVNYVNPESSTTVNFVDENWGDIDLSANDENALRQQEWEDYHCDNCEDISHKINQAVSKALDIAEKNWDFDIDPFNIPFDTDVVEDDMEKIRTPERI